MKRGFVLAVASILLASLVASCTKSSSDSSPTPSSSVKDSPSAQASAQPSAAGKEKRTITFATITGFYADGLKAAADDYMKLHPETTVKIDFSSDNQAYQTSFQAKMAAGGNDAPDIVHLNLLGDSMGNNIKKGWVAKLNDFAAAPNPYNNNKSILDGISNKNYVSWMYSDAGDIGMVPFDLVGTGFYYNKDVFAKAGVSEPTTWEDFLAALKKLKDYGTIPLAMSFTQQADYEGWLTASFVDWATRKLNPTLLVLPGDARNTPEIEKFNSKIKYDDNNPAFDQGAVYDDEKRVAAWKNKVYGPAISPAEKKYWTTMKEMSQFYQPGYATMGDADAYNLFISGKAAVLLNGSWKLGSMLADLKALGDKAFKVGVFKFPEYKTPDPNFPGKPRGILAVGHQLSVTGKKDAEQVKRAEDFLFYLFSPAVSQKVYDVTLKAGQFVQGPSLVEGVKLTDEFNSALEGFKIAGNIGLNPFGWAAAGNPTADPNVTTELKTLELKYYNGDISVEEYLKQKQAIVDRTMAKYMADKKYDLDPKTKE